MAVTHAVRIHATGEATGFIPAPGGRGKPITVIGTNFIRAGFDATCLQQALNARGASGVTDLMLDPDAHAGYGAPVGRVLTSPTHLHPGPVRSQRSARKARKVGEALGEQVATEGASTGALHALRVPGSGGVDEGART